MYIKANQLQYVLGVIEVLSLECGVSVTKKVRKEPKDPWVEGGVFTSFTEKGKELNFWSYTNHFVTCKRGHNNQNCGHVFFKYFANTTNEYPNDFFSFLKEFYKKFVRV